MNYSRPDLWRSLYTDFPSPGLFPTVGTQADALTWAFRLQNARVKIIASVQNGTQAASVGFDFLLRDATQPGVLDFFETDSSMFYSQYASSFYPWPVDFPYPRPDGASRVLIAPLLSFSVLPFMVTQTANGTAHFSLNAVTGATAQLSPQLNVYFGNSTGFTLTTDAVDPAILRATFSLIIGPWSVPLYLTNPATTGLSWSFTEASITPTFFP